MVMPMPQPGDPRAEGNKRLVELWLQTSDPTILAYINSNWTTPVSPAVQAQVRAIVNRYQGAGPVAQTSGGAATPDGPPLGPPTPQQYGPTAVAGPPSLSQSSNQVWPDQPPQATGTGYQGQRPFDQSGQTTSTAPVGGIFGGKDTGQGGGNPASLPANPFGAVVDEFGRPAGQNYANTVATDQAVLSGQRAAAAQAGGQRGGRAVSGFVPDPNNPLVAPPGGNKTGAATGPFGAIDPTSAIAQQGYAQAQAGDPTALSAVLTQLLGKFGIDVNRGGIFTPGLVSSVAPYLKTLMEYGGLANGGKPVIPSQLADQFGSMLGGANTFGQIQDFARGLLPTAQTLLGAPAGALADTSNQVGMVNDLLGMLTAGANPIYQQYQQGIAKKGLSDYVQSQLGGPTANYIDWMRQNASKIPGSDLLAQIIGGAGR